MLQVWPLTGIGEVREGDDLVDVILDASGAEFLDGDILVVTSKIVSKAEGRTVPAGYRDQAIDDETVRVVATRELPDGQVIRIVQNRLGIVAAAAGVDTSNTPSGTALLLPKDPDASALDTATELRSRTGLLLGVIISDTLGRPWREGQTDAAIGAAGVRVIEDLRGELDADGRPLLVTMPCVADELAAAAELVTRKANHTPVAVIRGRADLVTDLDAPGARSIIRPAERDMFRLGTDEAWAKGYAASRIR